jgi:hypothetical protein
VSGVQILSEDVAGTGTVIIQFYGPTNSSTTTQIAVDPEDTSVILVSLILKNSSV